MGSDGRPTAGPAVNQTRGKLVGGGNPKFVPHDFTTQSEVLCLIIDGLVSVWHCGGAV